MDKHTTKGLKYLSLSYIFKTMASQRYKNIYRIGSNLFKIYLRQTEIHFDKKNHDKSKNQKEISNEEWEKVIWRFTLHRHDVHQFSNNWGYDGLKQNTWGISGYTVIVPYPCHTRGTYITLHPTVSKSYKPCLQY